MTCNMKSPKEALIGDTFHVKDKPVEAILNVTRPKPMVFAGMHAHVTAITNPWVSYDCDMSKNVTDGCNKVLFDYKLLL